MNANWQIKILTEEDDSGYSSYLDILSKKVPFVLAYHYPFYRNAIKACNIGEPFYIALFIDGEISGVLPGFIKSSDIGAVYCSMPFFGPNTGVLTENNSLTKDIHTVLVDYILNYLKQLPNAISATFYTPFLFSNFNCYGTVSDGFIVPRQTLFLDIQHTEWDSKIKYDLRKAKRLGVSIEEKITDARVDELYEIYEQNCLDYGIPIKPRLFIEYLKNASLESNHTEFYFAYSGDVMIGGLIVLYSDSTLSYYLPCSKDSARTLQPVTVLIDYAFIKAKSRGIQYWNWESSPDTESGVYKFKKKWGSKSSEYKVYSKPLRELDFFRKLGKERISQHFPFYFVIPFHELD